MSRDHNQDYSVSGALLQVTEHLKSKDEEISRLKEQRVQQKAYMVEEMKEHKVK